MESEAKCSGLQMRNMAVTKDENWLHCPENSKEDVSGQLAASTEIMRYRYIDYVEREGFRSICVLKWEREKNKCWILHG